MMSWANVPRWDFGVVFFIVLGCHAVAVLQRRARRENGDLSAQEFFPFRLVTLVPIRARRR